MVSLTLVCAVVALMVVGSAASPCYESYDSNIPALRRMAARTMVRNECGAFERGSDCFDACRSYFMAKALPICGADGEPTEPCRDTCVNFKDTCGVADLSCPVENTECSEGPVMKARPNPSAFSLTSLSSFFGPNCVSLSAVGGHNNYPALFPCANIACNQVVASTLGPLVGRIDWNQGPVETKHRHYKNCQNVEGAFTCTQVNQTSHFGCFLFNETRLDAVPCTPIFEGSGFPLCVMQQEWRPECRNRNCCARVNADLALNVPMVSSANNFVMKFHTHEGAPGNCVSFSSGYDHCQQNYAVWASSDISACKALQFVFHKANGGNHGQGAVRNTDTADNFSFDLF